MAAWVHLAREALHAEWPTFEAIRAFSVFQLRPRLETSIVKKDLGKICQIFGEQNDLAALTRRYQDIVSPAATKRLISLCAKLIACAKLACAKLACVWLAFGAEEIVLPMTTTFQTFRRG